MVSTGSSATSTTESETSSATESEAEGSSLENEEQPFLYNRAFDSQGVEASMIANAILVFNMGLVHHLQDKSSPKVSSGNVLIGACALEVPTFFLTFILVPHRFCLERRVIFMKLLRPSWR